jgi:hypothetical protein
VEGDTSIIWTKTSTQIDTNNDGEIEFTPFNVKVKVGRDLIEIPELARAPSQTQLWGQIRDRYPEIKFLSTESDPISSQEPEAMLMSPSRWSTIPMTRFFWMCFALMVPGVQRNTPCI